MEAVWGALVALVFLGVVFFVRALQGVYDGRHQSSHVTQRNDRQERWDRLVREAEQREADALAPWAETVEEAVRRCQS